MRERRNELDLTQREVADLIPGKTEGKDISRWERGLHRPNSDTLSLIAEALRTDLADLYAGPVAGRKQRGATPDLLSTLGDGDLSTLDAHLDRIEGKLDEILRNWDARWALLEADETDPETSRSEPRSVPGSSSRDRSRTARG